MSVSLHRLRSRLKMLVVVVLLPAVGLLFHWVAAHRRERMWESITLTALLLSAAAAWWAAYHLLWRPFDALVEATRRLKAGDPQTRLELPREFGRFGPLATVVDEFAEELQRREAQQSRAREEIRRLNRALKVFSGVNQAVIRAADEQQLLESVCQIVVRDGGYRFAWVGLAEQDEAKTVRPVAEAGFEEGYLDSVKVTWADSARGRGPMGTAVRTGQIYPIRNILKDPAFAPWVLEARKRGYSSVLGLPLLVGGKAFGALAIYAAEPDAFDPQEIELLTEMADDLSYGIVALRTQAERDRAESSLRLTQYSVDHFGDAAFWVGPDARFVYANETACCLLGYSRNELLALKVPDIDPLVSLEVWDQHWDRVKQRGSMVVESIYRTKDGAQFPVELSLTCVSLNGEEYHCVFARDITARKQAEESLQRSEERFRLAFERGPVGIVFVGPDLHFLRVNHAMCEMLRYSEAELLARTVSDITHPDDRDRDRQMAQRILSGQLPNHKWEKRYIQKSGEALVVEVTANLIRERNGTPLYALGIVENITQRKQAEQQLLRKTEELQAVFQSLPDLYFRMRRDGTILDYLSGAQRSLYVPPEQFLGKRMQSVLPAEVGRQFEQALQELEQNPKPVAFDYKLPVDGQEYLFEALLSRLHGDEVVALVRDITERKRLEEQFRQAQKMEAVGRLAGGIAHDFNNMLGVIIGYVQILQGRFAGEETTERQLDEVKKAADRAAALTRQLLAFSRKQVLHARTLDLNTVVSDLSKMLRRMIGDDIELVIRAGEPVGYVLADPSQVEQVLMNLAVNARDAMPQGGKLAIETANVDLDETYARQHRPTVPGPYVMLAVSDTGCGMDADTQARIFEPFFTTKEAGKGTGLGLSTVYGVVKQSGGYIWVDSEPGHGTTFKIYLPRMENSLATQPAPKAAVSRRTVPATILLVEDEEPMRELTRTLLEREGFTVLPAKNGADALELVRRHVEKIDLLLTDVVMPGMSGREIAERLAALQPGLKTLYMSGYTDDLVVQHGVLGPGVVLVEKPFTKESLLTKVDEALTLQKSHATAG